VKERLHLNYDSLLKEATYVKTKSMPRFPHEYTLRETWINQKDFDDVVIFIRQNGNKEYFFKKTYIYYYLEDYKYWTMGNLIEKTILINRVKI